MIMKKKLGSCWDCDHQSESHTGDICHKYETCYYASQFERLDNDGD